MLVSILLKAQSASENGIELSIEQVTASPPKVSVSFYAQYSTGVPIWNFSQKNVSVKENGKACKIIALKSKADSRPITVGLVIDHSKSMEEDPSQLYSKDGKPLFSYDDNDNIIVPIDYVSPLDYAKNAILNFTSQFNLGKDYIAVTGFSSTVDVKLPPTQSKESIQNIITKLEPNGRTALYDAIYNGLNQIEQTDGIKALVVLTDGHDNESKTKPDDIINLALKTGTSIYLIGLGNVAITELQSIADQTRGLFYHTNSAASLQEIYGNISKELNRGYELTYISPSTKSETRSISLSIQTEEWAVSKTEVAHLAMLTSKNNQLEPLSHIAKPTELKQIADLELLQQENSGFSISKATFVQTLKLLLAAGIAAVILLIKKRLQLPRM